VVSEQAEPQLTRRRVVRRRVEPRVISLAVPPGATSQSRAATVVVTDGASAYGIRTSPRPTISSGAGSGSVNAV